MAPIVAEHLSAVVNRVRKAESVTADKGGSRIINLLFAILIIIMGVVSLPWFKNVLPLPTAKAGLISAETPIQATQVLLEKNPPERVFNAMSFGSYLIWAAYPQYQVFVDSRIELFSDIVWLDYLRISNADGDWEERLREYGVNTLMLSPVDQPALIQAVELSTDWRMIYQDAASIIFIRDSSSQQP
jgi:hypothetical protein